MTTAPTGPQLIGPQQTGTTTPTPGATPTTAAQPTSPVQYTRPAPGIRPRSTGWTRKVRDFLGSVKRFYIPNNNLSKIRVGGTAALGLIGIGVFLAARPDRVEMYDGEIGGIGINYMEGKDQRRNPAGRKDGNTLVISTGSYEYRFHDERFPARINWESNNPQDFSRTGVEGVEVERYDGVAVEVKRPITAGPNTVTREEETRFMDAVDKVYRAALPAIRDAKREEYTAKMAEFAKAVHELEGDFAPAPRRPTSAPAGTR